ncbi:hypothetical protein BBBGCB_BBBGCB_09650, partial [Dysosmobacter welbionis]
DLSVDEPADLVGHVLVYLLFDLPVSVGGVLQVLQDGLLLHIQNAAEAPGDIRLVQHLRRRVRRSLLGSLLGRILDLLLLGLYKVLDATGIQQDCLRGVGDGHDLAVFVVDRPPGGADDHAVGLLAHRLGLQFVVPVDLQIVQLPKQHCEGGHTQQQHDEHRPAPDYLVRPAGGVALSSGSVRHACSPFGTPGPLPPSIRNTKARSKKAPFL